jgi:predicted nucleic acid-binding protein
LRYLLDTNVVSETRRPRPAPEVIAWLDRHRGDDLFVSVLTLGEIRRSIELLRRRNTARASGLENWLDEVTLQYAERIAAVDTVVADRWGRLNAVGPRSPVDSLIAATALVHNMTVATRNVADFEPTGVRTVNPFEG